MNSFDSDPKGIESEIIMDWIAIGMAGFAWILYASFLPFASGGEIAV